VRKVKSVLPSKNRILTQALDAEPVSEAELIEEYKAYAERLAPFVADAGDLVRGALKDDRRVIFEGAQGTMLDIDHGTYPFVTSSNSCAVGIAAGCGISPLAVGSIRGVVKAYTTRVGEGPFPTELMDGTGDRLQKGGHEYGATTGRPRRCGWLDGLGLRYAVELNGVQHLAVTKLDVLGGVDPIRVCVAYDTPGGRLDAFPEDIELLSEVTPVYKEYEGWREDISGARTFEDLPEACRAYLAAVEEIGGAEIDIVSLGPDRAQTIFKPGCIWKPRA
jgi:adenylosuccinate synthase